MNGHKFGHEFMSESLSEADKVLDKFIISDTDMGSDTHMSQNLGHEFPWSVFHALVFLSLKSIIIAYDS